MSDRDERLPIEMARRNWWILAVLAVASLYWRSAAVTAGVLAGGTLVALNYHWMQRGLRRLVDEEEGSTTGRKIRSGRDTLLRFVVIGATVYVLIVHVPIHPAGFVVGLSVYVLNLAVTVVKRLY